jgi:antitoxin (DNA-binding transcriptional repressor) of toxin-antitoxin stability system
MKRIGVREFRDRATHYLSGDEAITVERHGKPIGYYIPIWERDEEAARTALERLNRTIEEILATTGMTEEELSAAFDLSRPLDDETDR